MPSIYEDLPDEVLTIPLEKVRSDLDLLQHAVFTDPKDQSSWNYHEWLISLILPIQIVALTSQVNEDKLTLNVGLSHKVRDFDKLVIKLTADGESVVPVVRPWVDSFGGAARDITEVWQIELPLCKTFELTINQPATEGRNLGALLTASTIDGLRHFRSFKRTF